MPSSKYYHLQKGRKPFSKIAPLWWNRIKEYGLENLIEPMSIPEEGVELDIGSLQYCIVGEAYDFYADDIWRCQDCLCFAYDFDDTVNNIMILKQNRYDENYYWDRLREAKTKFNTLRKEFTNHWNLKHES